MVSEAVSHTNQQGPRWPQLLGECDGRGHADVRRGVFVREQGIEHENGNGPGADDRQSVIGDGRKVCADREDGVSKTGS